MSRKGDARAKNWGPCCFPHNQSYGHVPLVSSCTSPSHMHIYSQRGGWNMVLCGSSQSHFIYLATSKLSFSSSFADMGHRVNFWNLVRSHQGRTVRANSMSATGKSADFRAQIIRECTPGMWHATGLLGRRLCQHASTPWLASVRRVSTRHWLRGSYVSWFFSEFMHTHPGLSRKSQNFIFQTLMLQQWYPPNFTTALSTQNPYPPWKLFWKSHSPFFKYALWMPNINFRPKSNQSKTLAHKSREIEDIHYELNSQYGVWLIYDAKYLFSLIFQIFPNRIVV